MMTREELLEYLTLEISDDIERHIKYFCVLFGPDAMSVTRKFIEEVVIEMLNKLENEKIVQFTING